MGVSAAIVLVFCIWCHRKSVRRREAKTLPHHVHVCERGARFAAMDGVSAFKYCIINIFGLCSCTDKFWGRSYGNCCFIGIDGHMQKTNSGSI